MSFLRFGLFLLLTAMLLLAQKPPGDAARVAGGEDPASELAPELKKFLDVLSVVQQRGAQQVAPDKLVYQGAIPSMLRRLDPHTQFFEPAQFDQLKQMEASEQKGFGSIVSVFPGQVIFLQILPGTPTSKAGIQPGDELVAINNFAIGSMDPQQIIELLSEARQHKISVYVRRQGMSQILQFQLTPELQDAPTVDRSYRLEPGIGYIRITSWDVQTAKQFSDAIVKLNANPMDGLIVDLRDNPGGVVKAALDGASMFLQPGQRILTAKGRTGVVESVDVPKKANPYKFRLALLINAKTASASEIFAGALQDHDRAIIIGEPSYGKGLVQSVLPLSGGAGLAITTAFYYTPSGRTIQRPLRNSALSNTFDQAPDSKKLPVYKTDAGRTVTGGGGITPDMQVAPASPTRLETVLDASGAVTAFATEYLAHHTSPSSPLPDSFKITPEITDEFKVFLSMRRIQPSVGEWANERKWVEIRLLEEIRTLSKGVSAGDQVAAQRDAQIQAALKVLHEAAPLTAQR
ncbi:MAG TPA: S41 family peptidase [Bryobacteraceae bacterium]|jgi:carboxyl-terminal processing protease|nr:S41 family peptidase [Bryobacteraceae bacterium]